jgi:hypothetical protein
MLLAWAEECLANGTEGRLVTTTDSCPVSFFPGVRQGVSPRRVTCSPGGEDRISVHGRSIASEAAWRLDAEEIVEIELDDSLQGDGGGGVAQIVRQDVIPGGVFGLQGDQPGDGVVPALCPGTPVGWPSGCRPLGMVLSTVM